MVVRIGVRLGVVGRFRDGLGRFGGENVQSLSDVVGVGEPLMDSSALDG